MPAKTLKRSRAGSRKDELEPGTKRGSESILDADVRSHAKALAAQVLKEWRTGVKKQVDELIEHLNDNSAGKARPDLAIFFSKEFENVGFSSEPIPEKSRIKLQLTYHMDRSEIAIQAYSVSGIVSLTAERFKGTILAPATLSTDGRLRKEILIDTILKESAIVAVTSVLESNFGTKVVKEDPEVLRAKTASKPGKIKSYDYVASVLFNIPSSLLVSFQLEEVHPETLISTAIKLPGMSKAKIDRAFEIYRAAINDASLTQLEDQVLIAAGALGWAMIEDYNAKHGTLAALKRIDLENVAAHFGKPAAKIQYTERRLESDFPELKRPRSTKT